MGAVMSNITDFIAYVRANSKKGVCDGCCGSPAPDAPQDTRCTIYNGFFNVTKLETADGGRFSQLFATIMPYPMSVRAGKEITYRNLGVILGDMEIALQAMALGDLLKVWKMNTPWRAFTTFTENDRRALADRGMISIIV